MHRPQPVPTQSKEILNDAVNIQESLCLVGRFKASHLPFPLSRRLMRYRGPIVRVLACVIEHQWHYGSMCHTVATELVGNESKRLLSLTLHELPQESPRRTSVPTGLYENIDDIAILIHRAPEILTLTVNRDKDFVQEPGISEATLSSSQLPRVVWTELAAPLSNRFVRHDDSSFGKQIFDHSEPQTELIVEPNGVADYFGRKTMPEIARSAAFHTAIVPRGPWCVNLTIPTKNVF